MNVLIIGCGDIGTAVGIKLAGDGINVTGVRRSAASLPTPITLLTADVTQKDDAQKICQQHYDVALIILTPDQFTDDAYRQSFVDSTENLLAAWQQANTAPKHVFFVSSTGVYAQNDGSWVDEDSPTEPQSFSGRRLWQAEQLINRAAIPSTIIRFGGIYGAGRSHLIDDVKAGIGAADEPIYTNRIHRDDCVGILVFLIHKALHKETLATVYIGVDSLPASAYTVKTWIADQLNIPAAQRNLTIANTQRGGNKRCSNQRTGFAGWCSIGSHRTGRKRPCSPPSDTGLADLCGACS